MRHQFFENCILPKTTKQVSGRRAYDPPAVRVAKATWLAIMRRNAPKEPFQGALRLSLCLTWPQGRKSRRKAVSVEPMAVRPDVDNLCKIILDAMTQAGFWKDDSQVADLRICKFKGPITGVSAMLSTWEEAIQ